MVASSTSRHGTRAAEDDSPVLVTGFDAFGGDTFNPSWLVAQRLERDTSLEPRVIAAQLPTEFDVSLWRLRALLREHSPALVICLGLAANRHALSLERVAINVNDARIPDNAGAQPIDTPVISGAPAAYFTRLPIKAMHAAIQHAGIAAEVSQTAGTFVCNHVFFGLMHELATVPGFEHTRGGFIHVPPLPGQASADMTLDQLAEGLRIGIRTALTTAHDIRRGAGAVA